MELSLFEFPLSHDLRVPVARAREQGCCPENIYINDARREWPFASLAETGNIPLTLWFRTMVDGYGGRREEALQSHHNPL